MKKLQNAQVSLLQPNNNSDAYAHGLVETILQEFCLRFGTLFNINVGEAKELIALAISLKENLTKQLELKDKAKK